MRQIIVRLAVGATLLWAGTAGAVVNCTATIRPKDGTILVGGKLVVAPLTWGSTAGTETNGMADPTCVNPSTFKAKNCTLGAGAVAITPPPLCTLYLKDASGTCAAFIKHCTPGARQGAVCGNGTVEASEDCETGNLNAQTCVTQGFLGGKLACGAGCQFDTTGCYATRFVNNGDGTVTDNQTGLMWEKKTGTVGSLVDCSSVTCSNPQNVNNQYQWCLDLNHNSVCDHFGIYSDNPPDGGAFADFLTRTNGALCSVGTCAGLGRHSDWRLPTNAELQTIFDNTAPGCTGGSPCIDSVFGPTYPSYYWSSTTLQANPDDAWFVDFYTGNTYSNGGKTASYYVRAVRGGL